MEKYVLTTEDYELINYLLRVTNELKEFYDNLMMLEINGQKDTIEFTSIKNILNQKIEEESTIYLKLGNDTNRLQALIEYFIEKNKINNFLEDLKVLVDGENDEIIKRRIVIKLLAKKLELEKNKLYQMGEELDKDLEETGLETKKEKNYAYYGLSNLLLLSSILKQDFLRTLLALIKKQIGDVTNQQSFHITYTLSFLYEFLEQDFLSNYSDERLFWSSKIVAELKCISDEAYMDTKKIYGYDIANDVCQFPNSDFWQLILRVSLLFCNMDELSDIKQKYPENIKDLLDYIAKDKEIPLVVSLKQRG